MCQKNYHTRRAAALLAAFTALLAFGSTLRAQIAAGGNFRLEQTVVAAGGGTAADASNSVYRVESTVGEAVAGTTSSGGAFSVKGGFRAPAPFAPTAGTVSVGGRVITTNGSGLTNARVTLTDVNGAARMVVTGKSGAFRFDDVNAGETYVISVNSKRYAFQPQVLSILENTTELVFVAQSATPF